MFPSLSEIAYTIVFNSSSRWPSLLDFPYFNDLEAREAPQLILFSFFNWKIGKGRARHIHWKWKQAIDAEEKDQICIHVYII